MMYAFCLSCPVRLLLSSLAVLYHAEWVAAKGLFVVLMCCVVLWFKLKYKVKINVQKYCERKRNTATMKHSKRMDNALTLFWRKTSDRKRDTPDRKLLLSALEETTLK